MDFLSATPCTTSDQHLLTIVGVLDRQLLRAADATLEEGEESGLLTWAHQHLIAPLLALHQLGSSGESPLNEGTRFSLDCVDLLYLLLAGDVTVGRGRRFQAVEALCADSHQKLAAANGQAPLAPSHTTRGRDQVEHFHRRLAHTAQRTRFHTERELAAILEVADANLIAYALIHFDLAACLDVEFPARDAIQTSAALFPLAADGLLSIAWTARGPVFWRER